MERELKRAELEGGSLSSYDFMSAGDCPPDIFSRRPKKRARVLQLRDTLPEVLAESSSDEDLSPGSPAPVHRDRLLGFELASACIPLMQKVLFNLYKVKGLCKTATLDKKTKYAIKICGSLLNAIVSSR